LDLDENDEEDVIGDDGDRTDTNKDAFSTPKDVIDKRKRKQLQKDQAEGVRKSTRTKKAKALVVEESKDPKNYKEAIGGIFSKGWKESMQKEFESLKKNGTWRLVPRPIEQTSVER
jgi:hypothetical protein